jgi:hypothetical protein
MWKKIFGASLAVALSTSASLAQTNPGLTQGQKLTSAQWNNLFASKQDTLGFTPLNAAGGVMTGRLVTAAPGASTAGFNFSVGTAPASPVNGDMWVTATGAFIRVNGSTLALGSSDATGWTSYSPTPSCQTGSGTWGTVTGRYKIIMSKTVVVAITGTLTTQGTCGGTSVIFTLPFATANAGVLYMGVGRETGTTGILLNGVTNLGTTTMNVYGASGAPPFYSGSIYNISLTYELP